MVAALMGNLDVVTRPGRVEGHYCSTCHIGVIEECIPLQLRGKEVEGRTWTDRFSTRGRLSILGPVRYSEYSVHSETNLASYKDMPEQTLGT